MNKLDSPKFATGPKRRFLPLLLAGVLGAGLLMQKEQDSNAAEEEGVATQNDEGRVSLEAIQADRAASDLLAKEIEPTEDPTSFLERMLQKPEMVKLNHDYCVARPVDLDAPELIALKDLVCGLSSEEPRYVGYSCDEIFLDQAGLRAGDEPQEALAALIRENCEAAYSESHESDFTVDECSVALMECGPRKWATRAELEKLISESRQKKLDEREKELEDLRRVNALPENAALGLQISSVGSRDLARVCGEMAWFRAYSGEQHGRRKLSHEEWLRRRKLQWEKVVKARNQLREDCDAILGIHTSDDGINECGRGLMPRSVEDCRARNEAIYRAQELESLASNKGVNISPEEAAEVIENGGSLSLFFYSSSIELCEKSESCDPQTDASIVEGAALVREECEVLLGDTVSPERVQDCFDLATASAFAKENNSVPLKNPPAPVVVPGD